MIANDWRRSHEFFQSPREAGALARDPEFSKGAVISFFLLRAIALALLNYVLHQWLERREIAQEPVQDLDPAQQMALEQLNSLLDYYYTNPIFSSLFSFVLSLVFTTFLWQIGRALSGVEISWVRAQSATIRYLLITACLIISITLLFMLTGGWAVLNLVGIGFQLYCIVVHIAVVQGALELRSYGQSLLVFFLSALAVLGVISVLSLFLGVMF